MQTLCAMNVTAGNKQGQIAHNLQTTLTPK